MKYYIVLIQIRMIRFKKEIFLYAGVPELAKGGGLKILWRRPTWVQIPSPALYNKLILKFNCLSGSGVERCLGKA